MIVASSEFTVGINGATFPTLVTRIDRPDDNDHPEISYKATCLGANGKQGVLRVFIDESMESVIGVSRTGQRFRIAGNDS